MSYCTITDVQALNPKRTYDTASTPTAVQVGLLIDQIAVEIDATLLSKGYEAPATTPAGWVSFLKSVNAYGAAALAEMAMFEETTGPGESSHASTMEKKYQDWLAKIEDGTLVPSSIRGDMAGSYYTSGDIDTDEYPEPMFTVDKDF